MEKLLTGSLGLWRDPDLHICLILFSFSRFPMLAQVQLLSEMQICTSADFRKQWPRKSWNSFFPNMDALLLPVFLSTRSLVSRQPHQDKLFCCLTGRSRSVLPSYVAFLPLEHIEVTCGPENAIFCWNCSSICMGKNRLWSGVGELESFPPWRCRFEACFMACHKFTDAMIFISKLLREKSTHPPYKVLINNFIFVKSIV